MSFLRNKKNYPEVSLIEIAILKKGCDLPTQNRAVHILAQPEHPFCSNLNTYSETS